MYAERLILETDAAGHLKSIPRLPENKRIEAIFLVLDESVPKAAPAKRRPHPDIVGKVNIVGDVLNSAPASDWDLPA